jgi:hypothetical protein
VANGSDRRTFLKQGAASAASLLVLSSCARPEPSEETNVGLDPALLDAVGDVVLPSDLGADGKKRVVSGFETWLAGYAPVPELMHGYGSQEIRYGPGDPAPRWAAQLAALDLEARKRWRVGFADIEPARRLEILRRRLAGADLRQLPNPTRVQHVAAALLAYWLATPEATNLCYRRKIDPLTCRPLILSPEEPAPLDAGEG